MKGNGTFSVLDSNSFAVSPQQHFAKWASRHKLMCWKCQKDKPANGGYLRIAAGLHKFICKDCMDAKEKAREG